VLAHRRPARENAGVMSIRRAALPLLLVFVPLLAGVSAAAKCPSGSATGAFLAPGSHGVGMRTITLVDTTRTTAAWGGQPEKPSRTLETVIWYPTSGGSDTVPTPDAPLAGDGPFPVIINSHGFSDVNSGAAYIAVPLASRGFVVVSPNFPQSNLTVPGGPRLEDVVNQPGDVRFVLDQVLALSADGGSWLAGGIDKKRIGAQGLSLGGLTTLLATYSPVLGDKRIKAALVMAPYSCPLTKKMLRTNPPLLFIAGTGDRITPLEQNAGRTFDKARMPRTLVTLAGATHTAFSGLVSFDATTNYDTTLGCLAVDGITQEEFDATLAAFGDAASASDLTGCELPCVGPEPAVTPMPATHQHVLTQATAVAFFEERFKKSKAARCFLRKGLDAEHDDVTVELKR
jgi:predicted dienelactone hydrolase